jgi:hypothetical protein
MGRVQAWWRRRADLAKWANAGSLSDLRNLMACWCEGELSIWPDYFGPRADETVAIGGPLAVANRAGFLTVQSQPGGRWDPEEAPPFYPGVWAQRAAVEGLADLEMLEQLTAAVAGTRLQMQVHPACAPCCGGPDYSTAVTVTTVDDHAYTQFGATLSHRDLDFMWDGIRPDLAKLIHPLGQVLVYDPQWGDHDLLWKRLATLEAQPVRVAQHS